MKWNKINESHYDSLDADGMDGMLVVLDMKSKSNHIVYHDDTYPDDIEGSIEYALEYMNLSFDESIVKKIYNNFRKGVPYLVKGRYSFELTKD